MQVMCDHCGNTVFADHGDTGIVDEGLKRIGWRSPEDRSAPARRDSEIASAVAEELGDLGFEDSAQEVSRWLEDGAAIARDAEQVPGVLGKAAAWLERTEASVTPVRRDFIDRLTASTVHRDISWQRTPEGLLACSGHCYEQLAVCARCRMPRAAEEHRGCGSFVPRCTRHL